MNQLVPSKIVSPSFVMTLLSLCLCSDVSLLHELSLSRDGSLSEPIFSLARLGAVLSLEKRWTLLTLQEHQNNTTQHLFSITSTRKFDRKSVQLQSIVCSRFEKEKQPSCCIVLD